MANGRALGYAEVDGVPQVFFGGGDGWVYGFDARGDGNGSVQNFFGSLIATQRSQSIHSEAAPTETTSSERRFFTKVSFI